MSETTRLLDAVRGGDDGAAEALIELLYHELHDLARARALPGRTLQPTALVSEVWLKLNGKLGDFKDRRHFLAVASQFVSPLTIDLHGRILRRNLLDFPHIGWQ